MPKFLQTLINTKNQVLYTNNFALQQDIHINTLEIAFCIWFIGVVVTSIYYINYNLKLYKRINSLKMEVHDSNMYNILESHIKNLEIKKEIKIYKLNGIYSPMLIGIKNPKIIIPNRDYSENNLNYIFRHELIHYKRKDNILKVLLILLNIIHWFNPFVYIYSKYFDDQCELSCDEVVIKRLSFDEIKEYSMLLIDTMKYKNKLESSMCASYLSPNKSSIIKSRIESMFTSKSYKKGNMLIVVLFSYYLMSVISINNSVYADNTTVEVNSNNMEKHIESVLDRQHISEMVNKYGNYEIYIDGMTYSFSKAKGVD